MFINLFILEYFARYFSAQPQCHFYYCNASHPIMNSQFIVSIDTEKVNFPVLCVILFVKTMARNNKSVFCWHDETVFWGQPLGLATSRLEGNQKLSATRPLYDVFWSYPDSRGDYSRPNISLSWIGKADFYIATKWTISQTLGPGTSGSRNIMVSDT